MKYILSVLFICVIFLSACSKSNNTSTTPLNEIPDTTAANINYDAQFSDGPHGHVTGRVKIYDEAVALNLALIDFNTSNGPDLHVYLSQEAEPIHFIELGKLKSTAGNQVYVIPGNPDFTVYKYVLIHCQQFNHVFGIASIK